MNLAGLIGQKEFVNNNFRGAFKYYYATRNGLFEWWLGLRPAWFSINVQDSVGRATISGMKMLDETGVVSILNRERLLGSNYIREEFTTSFARGVQEVGTEIVRAEPVVDKWLRGRSFRYGPLSHIVSSRQDMLLERAAVRADQGGTTLGGQGIRWMIDQYKITKGMLAKGNLDASTMLEFGLRQRTFATHYDQAFDVLDAHNLQAIDELIKNAGGTDETAAVFRKLWASAGDDAERLQTFLTVRDPSLRGTGRPRLYSEVLPDNFEEVLEAMLIDRRLRTFFFRPMVEKIEPIFKSATASNIEANVTKVNKFMDDVVRGIDEQFIARSDDFVPQPNHVDDAAGVRIPNDARAVDANEAASVNIGSESEGLFVTVEQLRQNDQVIRGFGPDYHARGALQEESMARMGDLDRELAQADEALTTLNPSDADRNQRTAVQNLRKYTTDVVSRLQLARDRTKHFLLHEFPGPLRYSKGIERDAAWDIFEPLGTQLYDSIIVHTDEAIEWATDALRAVNEGGASPAALELPSVDNILRTAGLELTFDGTRFGTFKVSENLIGRRTVFSGPQAGTYMKIQL